VRHLTRDAQLVVELREPGIMVAGAIDVVAIRIASIRFPPVNAIRIRIGSVRL
jgi:hypothetical protein